TNRHVVGANGWALRHMEGASVPAIAVDHARLLLLARLDRDPRAAYLAPQEARQQVGRINLWRLAARPLLSSAGAIGVADRLESLLAVPPEGVIDDREIRTFFNDPVVLGSSHWSALAGLRVLQEHRLVPDPAPLVLPVREDCVDRGESPAAPHRPLSGGLGR